MSEPEVKVMVHVKVDKQGRIQLPKIVRRAMKIEADDTLKLVGENGRIVLTKVEK